MQASLNVVDWQVEGIMGDMCFASPFLDHGKAVKLAIPLPNVPLAAAQQALLVCRVINEGSIFKVSTACMPFAIPQQGTKGRFLPVRAKEKAREDVSS